jgi:hypothetical protein
VDIIADTTPTKEADEKSIDMLVQDLAVQVAWGAGFPGLQHIEGAHCELVSEESRRALHALSAGRPGLQNIEGAHCRLVSIEGLRASGALCSGLPGLQHIGDAHCQLVSDECRRAWHALSAGCPGLQHIEGAHCHLVSVQGLRASVALFLLASRACSTLKVHIASWSALKAVGHCMC